MAGKVNYIIVGLGIAGIWLSYELLKRGHKIVVFNHEKEHTGSKKATGLYNPVTGRKMIKTWRADDFFPTLETDYQELENLLNTRFLYPISIYRPFKSVKDQNDWQGRQDDRDYAPYLNHVSSHSLKIKHINDPYGGIVLNRSGYVNLNALIIAYKNYLINKDCFVEEWLNTALLNIEEGVVTYKEYQADRIIFCEGVDVSNFWKSLPFRPVRGEIIDIECDLESPYVINQGVFMIPKNGYFTVGSTYGHSVLTHEPQEEGIKSLTERIGKIFDGDFQILEKRAGVRPATHDRKPFIGFHKNLGTLAIFNGFGTKGVSLSPYFAKHFADVLDQRVEIEKEINVQRVH
ncbi:MAG: FAD-binding oxidoreductase [Ekhidna sp.]|nr:FAD-binding oxidoreductase [Ekhidna sp.]